MTISESRTAVLITSAARLSALVASLTNFEITTPDGVFSNVDVGQCSMRSNIAMRRSTSTDCDTRFSRYEPPKIARPRTTKRPTKAIGIQMTAVNSFWNSAWSVRTPGQTRDQRLGGRADAGRDQSEHQQPPVRQDHAQQAAQVRIVEQAGMGGTHVAKAGRALGRDRSAGSA